MKKALLVAGGQAPSQALLRTHLQMGYDSVVAADRGADVLYAAGYVPDVVFGDMDSISAQARSCFYGKCPFITAPVEKDETDLTLCLESIMRQGIKKIVILGGLGGRTDHTLGNIMALAKGFSKKVRIILEDDKETICVMTSSFTLEGQKGRTVSFFAYLEEVQKLSLYGFRYKLKDYDLALGDMLCISNVVSANRARVVFDGGKLLMILEK